MRRVPERRPLPRAAAALALALAVAGCGRSASEVEELGRAAAVAFLDDLRAGRVEPAWEGASAEFKSLMGLESLRDYVATHPALIEPAEYLESRPVEQGGRTMTEYAFSVAAQSRGDAAPGTIKVLVSEGGDGCEVEHLAVE